MLENSYIIELFIVASFRFVLQEISFDGRVLNGVSDRRPLHDIECGPRIFDFESGSNVRQPHPPGKLWLQVWAVPMNRGCFMASQKSSH